MREKWKKGNEGGSCVEQQTVHMKEKDRKWERQRRRNEKKRKKTTGSGHPVRLKKKKEKRVTHDYNGDWKYKSDSSVGKGE